MTNPRGANAGLTRCREEREHKLIPKALAKHPAWLRRSDYVLEHLKLRLLRPPGALERNFCLSPWLDKEPRRLAAGVPRHCLNWSEMR